jgi:hypothetical protein
MQANKLHEPTEAAKPILDANLVHQTANPDVTKGVEQRKAGNDVPEIGLSPVQTAATGLASAALEPADPYS